MLKTLVNAFKNKDIRKKLLYTLMMLVVVRIGSLLPIPGVDTEYFSTLLSDITSGDMSYLNAFTGGSFEKMSLFALSITPYITSSIIMQLLTIAIPKLEEMQKEGEDGRKKIASITRYVTLGLALVESIAMAIGFGRQGLIKDYKDMSTLHYVTSIIVVIAVLTAGSALLMWIGESITENGVGNGISIVLLINRTHPQLFFPAACHLLNHLVFKAVNWSRDSTLSVHKCGTVKLINRHNWRIT